MSTGKTITYLLISAALTCLSLHLIHDVSHPPAAQSQECHNGQNVHTGLPSSQNANLQKLAEYEKLCHGAVVDRLMLFTGMPTTRDEATQFANSLSKTLQEFASFNIPPLVVFEPSLSSPTILSDIRDGAHDQILNSYYAQLKANGVTDKQMGTWILFPEANTPIWHTTNPQDFQKNVIKIATLQKSNFPTSRISLMLNSRTYPDNDTDWGHGELNSLIPYVDALPLGLVDSFGYQGFPSHSPANASASNSNLTVDRFLPPGLAIESAEKLHLHDIWFNTGTYEAMYTDAPEERVELSTSERKALLESIATAAKQSGEKGMTVSINIFAEDKSDTSEHTNWAYWNHTSQATRDDSALLKAFIHQLRTDQTGFSLYDHI